MVLARVERHPPSTAKMILMYDSFAVTILTRARESARRSRIFGVFNRLLRMLQTGWYGIEISKDATVGYGVYFAYPNGIVIGGTAAVGDRVLFLGGNSVGTTHLDNGYPVIEADVVLNPGARVLGPIRVGAGAIIGPNAVVLDDVPNGVLVAGNPARPVSDLRDASSV